MFIAKLLKAMGLLYTSIPLLNKIAYAYETMCYKQPSCLIRLHLSKHLPSFERPRHIGMISQLKCIMKIVDTDVHTHVEL